MPIALLEQISEGLSTMTADSVTLGELLLLIIEREKEVDKKDSFYYTT